MKKRCYNCKRLKLIEQFPSHKGYTGWCRTCKNAFNRNYYKNNKNKFDAYKLKARTISPKWTIHNGYRSAMARMPTKNPITIHELWKVYDDQKGKCALSGIRMTWINGTRKPLPTSISIDRINNGKGYTKKNVRLVCYSINSFRQTMTDKELLIMAKAIVRHLT